MERVTRKAALDLSRSYLIDLKKEGYNPNKVILFGSFAKGTQHQHSDIDLAIWDERFSGSIYTDALPLVKLKLKYPRIELHSFSIGDTKETNPFIGEILKEGIVIEV